MPNLNNLPFTYYGDLLGVSELYSIDLSLAQHRLDFFYNLVYEEFYDLARSKKVEILLFSDFLIVSGFSFQEAMLKLATIYNKLLQKNILIKGAVVEGRMAYEQRLQLTNLQKRLPIDDVLFRAASLEKKSVGMRILIETKLAKKILPRQWLVDEGYLATPEIQRFAQDDVRRKIVFSPDFQAYEYFWFHPEGLPRTGLTWLSFIDSKFFKQIHRKLKEMLDDAPKESRRHVQETTRLIKKTERRLFNTVIKFQTPTKKHYD